MFQNNTGTFTDIGALAPSSSTQSTAWTAYLGNDPSNTSRMRILATSTDCRVDSSITGTGTYLPMTFYTNGAEKVRIDTTGNLLVTGSTGALGYGTGSGGTVTQATSKTTAVTLNKATGRITMNAAALGSGIAVIFTLNNSFISATDTLIVNHSSTGGTTGAYFVSCLTCGAGSARIRVTNLTAGSLSEALTINFSVVNGATA
jgi:hypothetical protein